MKRRLIKSLPVLSGDATHVDIELYYSLGGMNYFTGNSESRGLFLSVQPVKRGQFSVAFTAFTGIKKSVLPMNRFNQRTLDTFQPNQEDINTLLNHVLVKQCIVLQPEN